MKQPIKGTFPATNSPANQRGMSMIGLVLAAIVVVFAAITVMKVVPMYLDDQKINTLFGNLEHENISSANEIRDRIRRNLEINQVSDKFDMSEFEISQARDGHQVSIDYERRARLIGNLSIVAEFEHSVRVRR